jgi:hypothetical protein
MGVHLVKKTGNPRTAQRQLRHKNHFITHISEDWTPSAQAKRVTY